MPPESEPKRPSRQTRRWIWILAVLFLAGSAWFFWTSDLALFPHKHTATLLVLEDSDDDFRTPPFTDSVLLFGPDKGASRIVTNLNICQTVGGGRSLGVSPDGAFFVVCESVGKHLTAYETQTGRQLWSVDGEFTAVAVAPDRKVYAVLSSGTIYGDRTLLIDGTGTTTKVIKSSNASGFDMALDAGREVVWLVGKSIQKCDLDLNILREITPIKWCAVSVAVNPDGSIWVAERQHPDVAQSTDRILKISPGGLIMKSVNLEWSPMCLRIDPADGSVWVTGIGTSEPATGRFLKSLERRTGALPIGKGIREFLTGRRVWSRTLKYDADGKLLCKLGEGGHSIDLQQSDGSLWLAGLDRISHYSREGKKLGRLGPVSAEQKYIVVLPEKAVGAKASPANP